MLYYASTCKCHTMYSNINTSMQGIGSLTHTHNCKPTHTHQHSQNMHQITTCNLLHTMYIRTVRTVLFINSSYVVYINFNTDLPQHPSQTRQPL